MWPVHVASSQSEAKKRSRVRAVVSFNSSRVPISAIPRSSPFGSPKPDKIPSHSNPQGIISSYETHQNSITTEQCLRPISRETTGMSPKKPGTSCRQPPDLYRAGDSALKQEEDQDPYMYTVEIIEAAVGGGEEEDWTAVFKRSAATGIQTAPPPSASGSSDDSVVPSEEPMYELSSTAVSCLNTPTMEFDEGYFAAEFHCHRRMTALPATVTSSSVESKATNHVMEVVVPVVTTAAPQSAFQFPAAKNDFDDIYDTWALSSGSPVYVHAPLNVVEGQVYVQEQPVEKKENKKDVVKFESNLSEFMTFPSHNTASAIDDGFKMESTEDGEELQPSTVLVDWVIDDSISAESAFPITIQDGDVETKTDVTAAAAAAPTAAVYSTPTTVVPSTINVADWDSIQSAPVPMVQLCNETDVADKDSRSPPAKRRRPRGRPPVPLDRPITPRVPHAARIQLAYAATTAEDSDHVYVTSDGYLTEQEVAHMKWRRGRDLNNVASKKCRENRKLRQQCLEQEAEQLMAKNAALKRKLRAIEAKVRRVKEYYLTQMLPGGGIVDPDSLERMWSS